jgi:hypothetical protein
MTSAHSSRVDRRASKDSGPFRLEERSEGGQHQEREQHETLTSRLNSWVFRYSLCTSWEANVNGDTA